MQTDGIPAMLAFAEKAIQCTDKHWERLNSKQPNSQRVSNDVKLIAAFVFDFVAASTIRRSPNSVADSNAGKSDDNALAPKTGNDGSEAQSGAAGTSSQRHRAARDNSAPPADSHLTNVEGANTLPMLAGAERQNKTSEYYYVT